MNNFSLLKRVRHVCFDMDGTIYEGGSLYPTTLPFLDFLKKHSVTWTYLSNNSSLSVKEYLAKLARMNIPATSAEFLNSTRYAFYMLNKRGIRRVHVMGTKSVCNEFAENGFQLDSENPDAVIITFDKELTYEKLCRTCWLLKKGIPGIATHPDVICPTDLPTVLSDCGAMRALIETAVPVKLEVWGKPQPGMIRLAAELNHVPADSLLMCGDRASTDISCGIAAGTLTAQIMSGCGDEVEGIVPDFQVRDLGELQQQWLRIL